MHKADTAGGQAATFAASVPLRDADRTARLAVAVLATSVTFGGETMLQNPCADSSRTAQTKLDVFFDCLAMLLARRWLRSQRQQEEPPPSGAPESPQVNTAPQ
jgi:hypothetical protein